MNSKLLLTLFFSIVSALVLLITLNSHFAVNLFKVERFDENLIQAFVNIYNLIDVYFVFLTSYVMIIGLFGLFVKSFKKKSNIIALPKTDNYNNFILMICAHNEESVIANSLSEMMKTNYPIKNLRVLVVCDNCNDNTYAEAMKVAKNYIGYIIVLERTSKKQRGKPFAVKYGLDWINHNLPTYDALSIADADNIYDKDFFNVMNHKLNCGSEIIQGYLGVKNPYETMTTTSGMYGYSASARLYFAARQNLKMSTTLGGTGFVVTKKAINEIGWDMKSLVEDLEFSTKAVIKGWKVDFAYDARTYDEKPTSIRASIKQRSRWMHGHWNVAFRMTPKLVWSMLTKPNIIHYTSAFDYLIYLWNPGRMLLHAWAVLSIIFLIYVANQSYAPFEPIIFGIDVKILLVLLPRLLEYIAAMQEGFRWWRLPSLIFYYTIFFIGWFPGSIKGFFLWPFQGKWDKTVHNAQFYLDNTYALPRSNNNQI